MPNNDHPLALVGRAVRAESMETILRGLLAREPAPATIKSETEFSLWMESRMAVALSVLLWALEHRADGVSVLPLGAVVPLELDGETAKIPLTSEVAKSLAHEDPMERDLLLLVSINNDVLKHGRGSRIILPGGPI
jgi:hypothetical protein